MTRSRTDAATCPFCGSADTAAISLFGMGEMTMQCQCRNCGSTFERVKWR